MDYFKHYRENVHKIKPVKNIRVILKQLSRHYILFVITSNSGKTIKKYFRIYKIFNIFKEILGREHHASKVSKIKYVLKKYKVAPKDCLFITDTSGDIKEARKCRIESIAITGGYHPKIKLAEQKPKFLIHSAARLPSIINNYFSVK